MIAIDAVIAYDIADNHRRDKLHRLLSGYGPRVQLSVFEATFSSRREYNDLLQKVKSLIDDAEDQVRLYVMTGRIERDRVIIGQRRIEERCDYWIV